MNPQAQTSVRQPLVSRLVHEADRRADEKCGEVDRQLDEIITQTKQLKRKLTPPDQPAVRAPAK